MGTCTTESGSSLLVLLCAEDGREVVRHFSDSCVQCSGRCLCLRVRFAAKGACARECASVRDVGPVFSTSALHNAVQARKSHHVHEWRSFHLFLLGESGTALCVPLPLWEGRRGHHVPAPRSPCSRCLGLLPQSLTHRPHLQFRTHQAAAMAEMDDTDKNVEMWKIKKLVKSLEAARG